MDEARIKGTLKFFDATQLASAEHFESVLWQCSWCEAGATPVATKRNEIYKVSAHFRRQGAPHASDCFNHPDFKEGYRKGEVSQRDAVKQNLIDRVTFPDPKVTEDHFLRVKLATAQIHSTCVGSRTCRRSIRAISYIHRNKLYERASPLRVEGVPGNTYWNVFCPVGRAAPAHGAETRIWFGDIRAFGALQEHGGMIEIAFNCRSGAGGGYVQAVADTRRWSE